MSVSERVFERANEVARVSERVFERANEVAR